MTSLNVETHGNKQNPAILMLHGFLGTSFDWLDCIEGLKETLYCIAIDLPGHGKSLGQYSYSFEETSKKISEMMSYLGIEKATVLGYSMGGRIAMDFACRYPEKCSTLILESAHPGLQDEAQKRERMDQDLKRAQEIQRDYPLFLEKWYKLPMWGNLRGHPEFKTLMEMRKRNSPEKIAKALVGFSLGSQSYYLDELKKLALKVTVITGAEDRKYCEIAKKMVEVLGRGRHNQISGAFHNVHFSHRDHFVDAIQDRSSK